mmetsp:Transcript_19311/g.39665  ORF Transcript_19311/g.39665 Transcript_19311/m.39665 type:complete len:354 (-) Transcript_19311:90-1151(-)
MVKHVFSVVIVVLVLIPARAFSPSSHRKIISSSSQSTQPHSSVMKSDNRIFSATEINLAPIDYEQISSFLSSTMISADINSLLSPWSNILCNVFQTSGNVPFIPSLTVNAMLFFSLRPKLRTMLTPEGFAHSLALGTMLWMTLGWRGWTVCVLYLFLGQLVTKVGFAEKEAMGIAEKRGGRRGPENVWGSALTGVVCASAAAFSVRTGAPFLGLSSDVWILAYVTSLATKISDTFASEIGKAYGKTTFLITTLKLVQPGTEGAVSLEGTLASAVGGFLLSIYSYLVVGLIPTFQGVAVASFSAFVATMFESLIGATMQEKEGLDWMTNEVVNFFNTLIGASMALLVGSIILGY